MEREEEGRMRTEDIAAGGQPPAREGEHAGGPPGDGAQGHEPGQAAAADPAGGGPGHEGSGAPQGGGEWQPQSPAAAGEQPGSQSQGGTFAGGAQGAAQDPHGAQGAHPQGGGGRDQHGAGAQGGAGPQAQGGALTAEQTEGGGAPGGGGVATEQGHSGGGVATEHGHGGGAASGGGGESALLAENDASEFERRWQDIQVGFVDEPQRCVQEADGLVAEVMQRLADGFARERNDLEAQWSSGGEASTEDLRVALQRYRSFFNRLLKTS
jgi:hypothetical protein